MKEENLKVAVLYEAYYKLLWDANNAIILAQMMYWQQRSKSFDKFITEENKRREQHWMDNIDNIHWWIYKSSKELSEEIMIASPRTVSRWLDELCEKWYLERRNNPKYKRDKTYQYRICFKKLVWDVVKLWYVLPNWDIKIDYIAIRKWEQPIGQNDQSAGQDVDAIPETTTETTTYNKDLILPNSNEIWNSNKNCYIYSNTKYINKLEDEFDIVYDDIPLQRNWHKPYPKPMYETCKKISELCCIRNVKAVFTWEVINKFHYMFTQQWVDVDDLENEYTITNEKNILDVLKKERFWEFYYGKK